MTRATEPAAPIQLAAKEAALFSWEIDGADPGEPEEASASGVIGAEGAWSDGGAMLGGEEDGAELDDGGDEIDGGDDKDDGDETNGGDETEPGVEVGADAGACWAITVAKRIAKAIRVTWIRIPIISSIFFLTNLPGYSCSEVECGLLVLLNAGESNTYIGGGGREKRRHG